jgi:flagellar basal-body rod protein FlgB
MEGKFNVFSMLGKRLDWLNQRQRVLATNIANSDTPDFVPRDLAESQFKRVLRNQLAPVNTATTHRDHIRGKASHGPTARAERQGDTWETSPSGNAVIMEEQLIKVSKTQSDHQLITNLYRKHMDMFLIALRGANS